MDIFKKIELFNKINKFIEEEATGNPLEFSTRLKISRSQLYRMINFLKDHGATIQYSRSKKAFYYTKEFRFSVKMELKDLTEKEMKNINGGHGLPFYNEFSSVHFFERCFF